MRAWRDLRNPDERKPQLLGLFFDGGGESAYGFFVCFHAPKNYSSLVRRRNKLRHGAEEAQTKDSIRKRVWSLLQAERVTRFPGAEGRIPNFVGAEKCAPMLAELGIWTKARCIKINPDSPQRAVRRKALEEGKTLYMPVPRLRGDKPFIELDPKKLSASPFVLSSIKGASQYGRPVSLAEMKNIDLIVCGSVAVNRHGARAGKGGGFPDLEFGLLRESKKISQRTPVVTTVHPLQVIDDEIPMTEHDIPLDAIITPDGVVSINKSRYPRPRGIYWQFLSEEKIDEIPILKCERNIRAK
jgi:5-formyltetrahydrofolate cyclo-ligase